MSQSPVSATGGAGATRGLPESGFGANSGSDIGPDIRSDSGALRPSHQRILDAFSAHGTMTPDELAEKINRSVFYTRPRCSELRAMGLLHRTGEVRRNAQSGLRAGVLSL